MSDVVPTAPELANISSAFGRGVRTLVAARLVEDHGYKDRDHPDPGVRDPVRASGGVHLYRRHQGRDLDDDRRIGRRGIHLRRNRQAYPDTAQHRFSGDLRDLHSVGACLLQAEFRPRSRSRSSSSPSTPISSTSSSPASSSAASWGWDRRRPGEGLRQDIRAACPRLDRGGCGRDPGRDHAGPRRLTTASFTSCFPLWPAVSAKALSRFRSGIRKFCTNRRATCSRRSCRRSCSAV